MNSQKPHSSYVNRRVLMNDIFLKLNIDASETRWAIWGHLGLLFWDDTGIYIKVLVLSRDSRYLGEKRIQTPGIVTMLVGTEAPH